MKMNGKIDNDDRACKVCGKIFTVLHPDRWAYKQSTGNGQYNWFCSWKCLRIDEKQREEKRKRKPLKKREAIGLATMKHRDQSEVVRGVLAAMKDGADPRKWLKEIGYSNPYDTLKKLQTWAVKHDPEAAEQLRKIRPGKRGPQKGAKKGPRVVGRVVEKKEEKDGGLTVRVKLAVPAEELPKETDGPKEPKPLDGGEWEDIKVMTREEHAEAHSPVIKEIRLPEMPKRLKIAGLESDAIKKATWVMTGELIVLNNGSEMSMMLKPAEWRKLATEIETMLQQFGA